MCSLLTVLGSLLITEVDRADTTLLFTSCFTQKEKKIVKTCWFPAACGLPTGSGAKHQLQPHSALGSVKMLFTKVKHVASSWVKGALWQKSGPGSGTLLWLLQTSNHYRPFGSTSLGKPKGFSCRAPVEQLITLNYCKGFAAHVSFFPQFIALCFSFCFLIKVTFHCTFHKGSDMLGPLMTSWGLLF